MTEKEMIAAIVIVASLACVVAAAVVARRRRIQIERFAELAGVQRAPGESLDSLLARSAARFRVVVPAPRASITMVADEPLSGGDVVAIDIGSGRVRRAKGSDPR